MGKAQEQFKWNKWGLRPLQEKNHSKSGKQRKLEKEKEKEKREREEKRWEFICIELICQRQEKMIKVKVGKRTREKSYYKIRYLNFIGFRE